MSKSLVVVILAALLSACTFNRNPRMIQRPLDGNAIIVMPLKGSHSHFITDEFIRAFHSQKFNIIDSTLVRQTARELGIQAEHPTFPDGPSIYERSSQLAIAKQLGVAAFFAGTSDTVEISDSSFSGAHIYIELIKTDNARVIWDGTYTPGFWTTAITAKGHLKNGAQDLAAAFAKYERAARE